MIALPDPPEETAPAGGRLRPLGIYAERQERHGHTILGICQLFPRHRPLSFANAKVVPLVGLTWTIVQGVEPGIWKWRVRLDEKTVRSGIDKTRAAAVSAVERRRVLLTGR